MMSTIAFWISGFAFLAYIAMRMYGYRRWSILHEALRLVQEGRASSSVIGGERLLSWVNDAVRVQYLEPLDPECSGLEPDISVAWGGNRAFYGKQHEMTWGRTKTFMKNGTIRTWFPVSARLYLRRLQSSIITSASARPALAE